MQRVSSHVITSLAKSTPREIPSAGCLAATEIATRKTASYTRRDANVDFDRGGQICGPLISNPRPCDARRTLYTL
ncbi:hypothetical protein ALC53_06890 [Atta colombica]|uniref:Uncharacterized protein n=1 Tax=Atta colombica TaxID=520822 RepID=A0A195BEX2_9HYME|nr:hypothetical protein ALC53_06890 [Atta colombica]